MNVLRKATHGAIVYNALIWLINATYPVSRVH